MGLISDGTTMFDAGAMASGFGGSMTFIKKLTASGSGTLSFVDGSASVVLDSTYKEYIFTFNNVHPASADANLQINFSIDAGSNYNVAKTTSFFRTQHGESGSGGELGYETGLDLAQATAVQKISQTSGADNDQAISGILHLFNPSSTTFAKHFISQTNVSYAYSEPYFYSSWVAGYANTTSAIDAVQFSINSGNMDTGDICLYGIS
jgi:hypothetical protein